VPEQDSAAMAEALEKMLLDRDLAEQMGRTALRRVRERFSFEHYLELLVSHLEGSSGLVPVIQPPVTLDRFVY
jgi:glycosyltransferase involved in cell wall biosynthesis